MAFSKACYGRSEGNPNYCTCSAACLCDALSNRDAEGHGLQLLVLSDCMYIRDYDVACLSEWVTDIDWDGVITIPNSESEDSVEDSVEDSDEDRYRRIGLPRYHAFP